tara:strand:+ start:799 stop:1563 length:765 start_codon:yes stop_codon:yes gene_type:complete
MQTKILFLLTISLFLAPACTLSKNNAYIKPPIDNFVKVFKEAKIKKCNRKTKVCEEKTFYSTGSGLIIDLIMGETIVLSAGHVCSSDFKFPDDKKFSFSHQEIILGLDSKGLFHPAHVIISEQQSAKDGTADLCALFIPTIDYKNIKTRVRFDPKTPRPGDEVYYLGAPFGVFHPPTVPIFKGIYSGVVSTTSALATFPVAPGSSGGVVLNLSNKIVGVVYAVHPGLNQISMITNHQKTREFLIKVKNRFRAKK